MSKVIMMRGLPGSGKSTMAKAIYQEGETYRVNRDLLREMFSFSEYTSENEKIVVNAEKMIASMLLMNGYNVIVDDTNLGNKHLDMWKQFADHFEKNFETIDLRDTPIETCIERDKGRRVSVGEEVIKNLATKIEK